MAIISGFPGKSKPKLQDITVVSNIFSTSSSKWDVYDTVTANNGYDGIGAVNVKRIRPKSVYLDTAHFDTTSNTFTFNVNGTSITSSSPDWLGVVLFANETWEADSNDRKITQLIHVFEKANGQCPYITLPILTFFDNVVSPSQQCSSLLPNFTVRSVSSSQLILSTVYPKTINLEVGYSGYLMYNAIDDSQ